MRCVQGPATQDAAEALEAAQQQLADGQRLHRAGENCGALVLLEAALRTRRQLVQPVGPAVADALLSLSAALASRKRHDDALAA